jgi:hypothetical protein
MSITKVCGHVSISHPPPVISWQGENQINGTRKRKYGRRPKVQLRCPRGRKISSVLFSSFGTPSGDCEAYAIGSCHASNSRATVEKVRSLFLSLINGCRRILKCKYILLIRLPPILSNLTSYYYLWWSIIFSISYVLQACLGKERCSIPVSSKNFKGDPCPGIAKSLLVDAKCA